MLLRRDLLELIIGLAVIVHHALAELLHVLAGRFLSCKLAQFYFGQSTCGRLLYEGFVGYGGSRRVLSRHGCSIRIFVLLRDG